MGRKHTEETKEKMRGCWNKERRDNQRKVWLGKKHTEETKEKMKQSSHKADLIGKRFGKLLVVSLVGVGKGRQTIWLCDCECGNTKTLSIG